MSEHEQQSKDPLRTYAETIQKLQEVYQEERHVIGLAAEMIERWDHGQLTSHTSLVSWPSRQRIEEILNKRLQLETTLRELHSSLLNEEIPLPPIPTRSRFHSK